MGTSKVPIRKSSWNEDSFFKDITARNGAKTAETARAIYNWALGRGLRMWWGQGEKDGSFYCQLDYKAQTYWTVSVWTSGRLLIPYAMLKKQPPFDELQNRQELANRFNEIKGVNLKPESLDVYPSIPLSVFSDEGTLEKVIAILNWIVDEIKSHN